MPDIKKYKLLRMAAAYKLRLVQRAEAIGARQETWGRDRKPIQPEDLHQYLTDKDSFRIAPYPYPGLRSFDPEEGELFFGRERNVEALRTILAERRLVVVLGGSGSGKSSLIRAGLLPFLNTERRIPGRDGNWYSAEFRPRTDPLGELAKALVDQVALPLLKLRRKGLHEVMGLRPDQPIDSEETVRKLHDDMRLRFVTAKQAGRAEVLKTLLDIVDRQLDRYDDLAARGRRLAEPNLLLLVDQLEEIFRPEVPADERKALLDLIVDLQDHMKHTASRGGLFLAATIRSEEVHRCAEHRGLSEVVIGSGYQIELLDPNNPEDAASLRSAIVEPARNVFRDWGLGDYLDHADAPFEKGFPELLLKGAGRLSAQLDHRPDQLPLLQHALQATWHRAMRSWSDPDFKFDRVEITRGDLPGQQGIDDFPDLSACLDSRANKAKERAAERFAEAAGVGKAVGEEALRAAFRALARRDDRGNWARRFAGRDEITSFLTADPKSAIAKVPDEVRWSALESALHVFLLRGYLSGGGQRKYDISHEALIRNWPLFQTWLRDPEEVAYALARVLIEVDPNTFEKATAREKIDKIPAELAKQVLAVSPSGNLPTRWGEDQIAPYLLRSSLRSVWGGDKHSALLKLTDMAAKADQARDNQEKLKSASYGAAGLVGVAIVALVVAIWARGEVQHAQAEAAKALARQASASSVIGSMLSEAAVRIWPQGARERAALQALTIAYTDRGRIPTLDDLREFEFARWDTGVRDMLGRRYRVTLADATRRPNEPASCLGVSDNLTIGENQENGPPVLLSDEKTKARVLPPTLAQPGMRLAATADGREWREAVMGMDGDSPAVGDLSPGTRICLAANGTVMTISRSKAPLPSIYEMYWRPCKDEQVCGSATWRVGWREIYPGTIPETFNPGAKFSCVRSIRPVGPGQTGSTPEVTIDFTAQGGVNCDPGLAGIGDQGEDARLFSASYVAATGVPMMSRPPPELLAKFSPCRTSDQGRECDVGLPAARGKPTRLYLDRSARPGQPVEWKMRFFPVTAGFALDQIRLPAPAVAAAIDERNNIWLKDDDGNIWQLINSQVMLKNALWERVRKMVAEKPTWYDPVPEVSMFMNDNEKSQTSAQD